jgi:hypothetical protein
MNPGTAGRPEHWSQSVQIPDFAEEGVDMGDYDFDADEMSTSM